MLESPVPSQTARGFPISGHTMGDGCAYSLEDYLYLGCPKCLN